MRIKIHHETHYQYDVKPSSLVQRLHLTPSEFAGQKTVNWTISAQGIEKAVAYVDGFGNRVHLVTAEGLGHSNTIVAQGEVETFDMAGVVNGLASVVPDNVFLRKTAITQPDDAIAAAAQKLMIPGKALEQAHGLMQFVHGKVAYEIGTSQANTTAAEVFAAGRGVCQDHAHLMISMARSLAIPARYVTGYLVTGVGAASVAAHAWCELMIPDLGWVGFDPANCQSPTAHYVRVAAGLDAAAVAPVRGSRRGSPSDEHMTVAVRVEIAQQ